jgi:WD40 repeat protein
VWDVHAAGGGELLASASADGTVRVWRVPEPEPVARQKQAALPLKQRRLSNEGKGDGDDADDELEAMSDGSGSRLVAVREKEAAPAAAESCVAVLGGHAGDVYSCCVHPQMAHVVSGGYDKAVNLFDLERRKVVRAFKGHAAPVSSVRVGRAGSLVVSGSKDRTIKLWDPVSGACVRTVSSLLGEVTSVDVNDRGTALLCGSRDNTLRLFDIKTGRALRRFTGHQNTLKNFVRCAFGPEQVTVVGGSEDGCVYCWDAESEAVVERLVGHAGVVYSVQWSSALASLVSCSDDKTLRVWRYDPAASRGGGGGGAEARQ